MRHEDRIRTYVINEFIPDVDAADVPADRDLLADSVIDSLGLLKLIAWIEDEFDITISDDDLDPDNFRSIAAVNGYVEAATGAEVARS